MPRYGDLLEIRTIPDLEETARDCTDCTLAYDGRSKVVFGVGPINAQVMLVGEGPGDNEDRTGIPFTGPAGVLLNSQLEETGFTREDLYITNIVKCRPSGNRTPTEQEIFVCKAWLARQIEIINPRIIVAIGNPAVNTFFPNVKSGITKFHGQIWTTAAGRKVMPLIHPAAALRNEEWLQPILDDLHALKRWLDEQV